MEAALRNSYMISTLTVRISQPGKPAEEAMIGTWPNNTVFIDLLVNKTQHNSTQIVDLMRI